MPKWVRGYKDEGFCVRRSFIGEKGEPEPAVTALCIVVVVVVVPTTIRVAFVSDKPQNH